MARERFTRSILGLLERFSLGWVGVSSRQFGTQAGTHDGSVLGLGKTHQQMEVVLSIGGVILGWALSVVTSRLTRRDEQERARRERVMARQDEAAAVMDQALLDAATLVPHDWGDPDATATALSNVHSEWQRGWVRSTLIDDPELNDRYAVVGMITFHFMNAHRRGTQVNLFPLSRAIANARISLAAYRREQPLPPASFPGRAELGALTSQAESQGGYTLLSTWLSEHPEAV